jgi:colanic acid biosynthesis glycosyl transferase WcaI
MHVLFLTSYFTPCAAANAFIMDWLARYLVAAGHSITVVTSMPHYDDNRIWPEYRGKLVVREPRPHLDIRRVYVYLPPSKTNLVGRLLSYASFNALSTAVALVAHHYDVIFAPSPPLTNGFTAYLIGLLQGVPYIYNVQDVYPDVAITLGALTNRWAIVAFRALEQFVYRKAAAISVISEGFRCSLQRKGVPSSKLHVIPNFMDINFVRPLPRHNDFSREHGLDDRYVVMFAGNVGLSQGLEYILDAASKLSAYPDILFLIVGNGTAKPELMALAKAAQLSNVRFLPYQPWDSVPALYATTDVCLVPLRHGISLESVPSKVYTIMSAGKPLIAAVDQGSDTWQLVTDTGCGVLVPPEHTDAMVAAILSMYRDQESARRMGMRGRERMEMDLTPESAASQYEALFKRVIRSRHASHHRLIGARKW